jgi:hypothetical protein
MGWSFRIVDAEGSSASSGTATPVGIDELMVGEVLRGVRDQLVASFHLEIDWFPPLGALQGALEKRVRSGAPERHRGATDLALAGWRGGWHGDGTGRLEADIFGLQGSSWHTFGHAVLNVDVDIDARADGKGGGDDTGSATR